MATAPKQKQRYVYAGPVEDLFGKILSHHWSGQTFAVSPAKAATNLAYQFKKQMGLIPAVKVKLLEKPVVAEEASA